MTIRPEGIIKKKTSCGFVFVATLETVRGVKKNGNGTGETPEKNGTRAGRLTEETTRRVHELSYIYVLQLKTRNRPKLVSYIRHGENSKSVNTSFNQSTKHLFFFNQNCF